MSDQRKADWYVLGPRGQKGKQATKHYWEPPVEGSDLWRTICTAHVIGERHVRGLRKDFDTRMNKRCIDCQRRRDDLPPLFVAKGEG